MGILSLFLNFCGFGVGTSIGLVIGYYLFIYSQPTDVKDPAIRPLVEQDSKTLQRLLPEMPSWVKYPADYDCVDWLNKFLELMWPYLDNAICKTARTTAEPIIADLILKYKIDSVEFEALSLGSLPPTFQGMKVYETDEKEVMMDVSMKWAGNPNILVAAKAFGLKATVQVVDLQVFATPRIILKPLVPAFPFFSTILVSLMEKPHVDLGLKLLGADVMAIPGLYGFVQELLKDEVANIYLWPKSLQVQIMDPAMPMKKPVGILHVKVVKATKLKREELLGAADPYVKLKLTEDKLPSKKTIVKHNTLNPEWNQEFSMLVRDPETQALEIMLYDWDKIGRIHEKIGINVIPLKELTPREPKVMTVDLLKNMNPNDAQSDKLRGQLSVELLYKPSDAQNEMPNKQDEDPNVLQKGTPTAYRWWSACCFRTSK